MSLAQPPPRRPPAPADPLAAPVAKIVELVTKVLGPTTVLAAMTYYLGWVRTDSLLRRLNIDSSLLSFTPQEYILRSSSAMLEPLRWLLVTAFVVILLHSLTMALMTRWACLARWPRRFALCLGIVMAAASEMARAGASPDAHGLEYAQGWTAGIGLIAYGWTVAPGPRTTNRAVNALLAWVTGALFVSGLFWVLEINAGIQGSATGDALLAGRASGKPCAIVHSRDALGIQAPGVVVTEQEAESSAYRYRYSGLRFLIRSGEKLFLLPSTWDTAGPVAIVLPDSEDIRLDLVPGTAENGCPPAAPPPALALTTS